MSDGPTKDALASAEHLCTALRKALNARRTYAPGHQNIRTFLDSFSQMLLDHLETHGDLQLNLGPQSADLAGEMVYSADSKAQSMTYALFLDGVQQITFHEGLERPDIQRILEIWDEAISDPDSHDTSFSARLWDIDFEHISSLTLDELAIFHGNEADSRQAQRLNDAIEGIRAVAPVQRTAAQRATAQLLHVKDDQLVDRAAQAAENTSNVLRLGPEELTRAQSALATPPTEVITRGVKALLQTASHRSVDEQTQLVRYVEDTFLRFVKTHLFEEAALIARTAMEDRPGTERQLGLALASSDARTDLLEAFEDEERAAGAAALVEAAGDATVPALLAQLPEASEAARARLLDCLKKLRLEGDLLAEAAPLQTPDTFPLLIDLALSPRARGPVEVAGLSHDDPDVRNWVFQSLTRSKVKRYRSHLHRLLTADSQEVRRSVMTTLIAARDRSAVPHLAKILDDRRVDLAETRMVIAGLGALGGDLAGDVLLRAFNEESDPDLRVALALALGRTGFRGAINDLEVTARRLFATRKLKEACREALRRIELFEESQLPAPLEDDDEEEGEEIEIEVDDEPAVHSPAPPAAGSDLDILPERDWVPPGASHLSDEDAGDLPTDYMAALSELDGEQVPTADVDAPWEEDTEDAPTDPPDPPDEETSDDITRSSAGAFEAPPDLDWKGLFQGVVVVEIPGRVVFGTKYGTTLTDLHAYNTTDVEVAYRSLLFDKIREGFVPQLRDTWTPPADATIQPLDVDRMLQLWGDSGDRVQATSAKNLDVVGHLGAPDPKVAPPRLIGSGAEIPAPSVPLENTPRQDQKSRATAAAADEALAHARVPPARILAVDDREFNLDLVKRVLEKAGHTVLTADRAQKGLEILMEEDIDLICLDVNMPEMTGLEFADIVRRQFAPLELPIIFITARDSNEEVLSGFRAGANDYLTKPVSSQELTARVSTQLLVTLAHDLGVSSIPQPKDCNVLVVDPKEKNRRVLRRWLRKAEQRVFEAENLQEARRVAQERELDLLVIDSKSGDCMDWVVELRRTYNLVELPIVVMTRDNSPLSAADVLRRGANDFIVKPIHPRIALERMMRQLEVRTAYQEATRIAGAS